MTGRWLASIGGVAAIGAAVWYLRAPAPSRAPDAARHGAQSAAAGGPLACAFSDDERLGYTLHLSASHAQMVLGQSHGWERTALDGVLQLRALETGAEAVVAARLQQPKMTSAGQPVSADVLAGLSTPVLVHIDRSCRVRDIAFPASMPLPAGNQWRALFKMAELSLADGAGWRTRQVDTLGEYDAAYTRAGDQVTRKKVAYTRLHTSPGQEMPSAELVQASAKAKFAAGRGWPAQLEVAEHVRVKLRGQTLLEARGTLQLDAASAANDWSAIDRGAYKWVSIEKLASSSDLPYAHRPAIPGLAGRSPASIFDEFGKLVGGARDGSFDQALNLMVQAMRLRPELCDQILQRIRAQSDPVEVRSMMFLALQLSGLPEAQKVLTIAMDDRRLAIADRLRAASALADVPNPNGEVLTALMDAHRSAGHDGDGRQLGNTTLFGIGAMAHSDALGAEDRVRVHDVVASELQRASSPEDLRAALAAAGNTGDPRHADAVKKQLGNDDPGVRAEAWEALGRFDALPSEKDLVDAFLREDSEVQRAMSPALVRHADGIDDATVQRCIAALATTTSVPARLTLVEILGVASRTNPAAKAALRAQFRVERDPAILSAIGRYLTAAELN